MQTGITKAEREVDAAESVTAKRKTIEADIEDKDRRLQKIKDDIKLANFEERLGEKASKGRSLEVKRDELNAEIRALSFQADTRARLDLKREELKTKENEVKNAYVN